METNDENKRELLRRKLRDRMAMDYTPMHATHVVVDITDGYTFWRGADSILFTESTAKEFALKRNEAMERKSYRVFRLVTEG